MNSQVMKSQTARITVLVIASLLVFFFGLLFFV